LEDPHPEPAHKFEVTLEPDNFTDEKFALYSNYQAYVHHDPPEKITEPSFTRFLCNSPLRNWKTRIINGKEQKLGSFHQCYRLDGRLIAMAVLDLLPHCVSGVYFIYHSDYEKFSFGKISALREAALAIERGYDYYYMGYYIHSCVKMRYKNDYKPQHVLDLETMEWHELDDEVWKLLDNNHYMSVSLAKAVDPPQDERTVFESAEQAADAYENGVSLFNIKFAGMMSETELQDTVDLDHVLVRIKKDVVVQCQVGRTSIFVRAVAKTNATQDFVKWEDWSIHDNGENFSIKGAVAQLAACIGPEVAKEVIVSFA
jgi:arginine-tRNA-protein transferase